ncbi:hypothetical protein CBM2637_A70114 [Cupriavidus taiwanensis]|nr:hypothetical protein CBM2637_A70114 [Cupriavidus taiwanensis]
MQFKHLANQMIEAPKEAPLPPGFSPGMLLIEMVEPHPALHDLEGDEHHWGDIFEGYMGLWKRLADFISP